MTIDSILNGVLAFLVALVVATVLLRWVPAIIGIPLVLTLATFAGVFTERKTR